MAILNEYKDKRQGLKLSTDQVDRLESICPIAENLLSVIRPEMKDFKLSDTLSKTNVYWADAIDCKVELDRRNSFDEKMMREYYSKIEECDDDEKDLLSKMYGPWSGKIDNPSRFNILGWYDPDTKEIFICLERIKSYPKSDSILAKVLLHELGHAIMHNDNHLHYENLCDYWMEESLANKLMLTYLNAYDKEQPNSIDFDAVVNFVQNNQTDAYRFGYNLFEHNLFDCQTLQEYKE